MLSSFATFVRTRETQRPRRLSSFRPTEAATADGEEATRITGIAHLVRGAVELWGVDPAAACDSLRTTADLLRRRALVIGGDRAVRLHRIAACFDRAAQSGDPADLRRAESELRPHRASV